MDMNFNSVGGFYQKAVKGSVKATKTESSGSKHGVVSDIKAENSDKVSISSDATEKYELYRMTKNVMKDFGEFDNTQKVAELKKRIESGTYQVPIEQIAEKMTSRFIGE